MAKRVLLVSSNSSGRGGGERYLLYLAQGLVALGHEVHALLSAVDYMDAYATELESSGAHVHRRNLLGLKDRPLRFIGAAFDRRQQAKVSSLCIQIRPDVVLVNQQYDEDGLDYLAGALASKVGSVGGVMHLPMTHSKDLRPLGRLRGKFLKAWYRRHRYSLILTSRGSLEEFVSYYGATLRATIVHNACAFPDVKPLTGVFAGERDALPVIGFCGQFVPQKNLGLLIQGWLRSTEGATRTRLLLIGDGPERPAIEEQLRGVDPGTWRITGWGSDYARYFSQVDVFAMTSAFESSPLAFIEAVGRGLPAIVTNFNGAADVAALAPWVSVMPSRDAASVSDAIRRAVERLPELKQMAASGRAAFQSYFSPQRMAAETIVAVERQSD